MKLALFTFAAIAAAETLNARLPSDAHLAIVEIVTPESLAAKYGATVKDDRRGLVTITVPRKPGQSWEDVAAAAAEISVQWKFQKRAQKPGWQANMETWRRVEWTNGSHGIVGHIFTFDEYLPRPHLTVPPFRPRP